MLQVKGDGAWKLFRMEAGGHRWQRIPPTETKGRRHSSTFTVAVFRTGREVIFPSFNEDDVSYTAVIGHGPGGQHRNKTATAIQAVHKPTGERVFIQSERSQLSNLTIAIETLRDRVESAASLRQHHETNDDRKSQIGSGERSDKIRTVQEQNDKVIDHRTGKKCSVKAYCKGEIWRLLG